MKNRLFWDTNIMLDLLGERLPYYEPAAKIATLADNGDLQIVVSALSFLTVNYFLSKYESPEIAKEKLRKFRIISEICNLDEEVIEKGLASSFPDFEVSIQYFSAIKSDCGLIITRNARDFKESLLPVMTTGEYLASIKRK